MQHLGLLSPTVYPEHKWCAQNGLVTAAWKQNVQILCRHGRNRFLLAAQKQQGVAVEPQGRDDAKENRTQPEVPAGSLGGHGGRRSMFSSEH